MIDSWLRVTKKAENKQHNGWKRHEPNAKKEGLYRAGLFDSDSNVAKLIQIWTILVSDWGTGPETRSQLPDAFATPEEQNSLQTKNQRSALIDIWAVLKITSTVFNNRIRDRMIRS